MQPPTKWHLARVGLLTWFLGLASGWMLFSGIEPSTLHVPGARAVTIRCDGYEANASGPRIPLSGRAPCEVSAELDGGGSASGDLRVTLRGTNTCRKSGDALSCDSSLP